MRVNTSVMSRVFASRDLTIKIATYLSAQDVATFASLNPDTRRALRRSRDAEKLVWRGLTFTEDEQVLGKARSNDKRPFAHYVQRTHRERKHRLKKLREKAVKVGDKRLQRFEERVKRQREIIHERNRRDIIEADAYYRCGICHSIGRIRTEYDFHNPSTGFCETCKDKFKPYPINTYQLQRCFVKFADHPDLPKMDDSQFRVALLNANPLSYIKHANRSKRPRRGFYSIYLDERTRRNVKFGACHIDRCECTIYSCHVPQHVLRLYEETP